MRAPNLPWRSTCDRDRDALVAFTIGELMREDSDFDAHYQTLLQKALLQGTLHQWRSPPPSYADRLEAAKTAARGGNLKPLRKMFPDLAEFLAEPKRKKGQRRPPHWTQVYGNDHRIAVDTTIRNTRRIWKREFEGRWRRPATDTCMLRILMGFLQLSEADVRRTMKALNR